ncbi:MAG: DUF4238 domain-containing protein [Deltaproteobacteria bacterium]|nr:DUF4238 domain-containing protein [Deltaproteobacteria bacterium]
MALDHFVSQVYLKNFYSPKMGNLMYAIRKSDLKPFTPNSQSVCRIEEGNTNSYLREDRIVEEFLENIEPRYNNALAKLIHDNIDQECIFVIAGFIAYVSTCSPAAMRIHSEILQVFVEETAKKISSKRTLRPPPIDLGGKNLYDYLENKNIRMKVNPKFPQAVGITEILNITKQYGNYDWDILINPFNDSPFFTSDFPIAIECTEKLHVHNLIIPLAPDVSVRIRSNHTSKQEQKDYSFSGFQRTIQKLNRTEVKTINRLIVRCAETMVFFRDQYEWISNFVKKNACFRIKTRTQKVADNKGGLLWNIVEIAKITEQMHEHMTPKSRDLIDIQ